MIQKSSEYFLPVYDWWCFGGWFSVRDLKSLFSVQEKFNKCFLIWYIKVVFIQSPTRLRNLPRRLLEELKCRPIIFSRINEQSQVFDILPLTVSLNDLLTGIESWQSTATVTRSSRTWPNPKNTTLAPLKTPIEENVMLLKNDSRWVSNCGGI